MTEKPELAELLERISRGRSMVVEPATWEPLPTVVAHPGDHVLMPFPGNPDVEYGQRVLRLLRERMPTVTWSIVTGSLLQHALIIRDGLPPVDGVDPETPIYDEAAAARLQALDAEAIERINELAPVIAEGQRRIRRRGGW